VQRVVLRSLGHSDLPHQTRARSQSPYYHHHA
jgi:hypothetical protein